MYYWADKHIIRSLDSSTNHFKVRKFPFLIQNSVAPEMYNVKHWALSYTLSFYNFYGLNQSVIFLLKYIYLFTIILRIVGYFGQRLVGYFDTKTCGLLSYIWLWVTFVQQLQGYLYTKAYGLLSYRGLWFTFIERMACYRW